MSMIKKFSAVGNTQLLVKHIDELKLITFAELEKRSRILASYEKVKNVNQQNNIDPIKITEYSIESEYYIPSLSDNNIDITFNKINKLVKFENLTNMFEIAPVNLEPISITSFDSILDDNYKICNLADIKYIRNIKLQSSLFENYTNYDDAIDLTTDFGYILGQWISRGFIINKHQNEYNGNIALPILKKHLELLHHKIKNIENISYLHKIEDDSEYIIFLNNEINNFIKNEFTFRKNFPMFLYGTCEEFINGILYGIFHTNGTITFNKQKSRAFLTIKFINHEFAKQFLYFMMFKFGVTGSFSKMPNAKCCKISVNLNDQLKNILENAFTYQYTSNSNKLELWNQIQNIKTNEIDKILIKTKKSTCATGYNLNIENSKAYSLLNGMLIPVI